MNIIQPWERQSLALKTASAKTMMIRIFNIFKKYQGSQSDYRSVNEKKRERESIWKQSDGGGQI